MIVIRQKQYSFSGKLAILELSGGSVKLLLGPQGKANSIKDFLYFETSTKTNEGLSGGIMSIGYFKEKVLPTIEEYLERAEDYEVYCAATAWAREARNLDEVQSLVPVQIHVLSGVEESKMALLGYIRTAKRDLKKYDYLVSLDFGSKSTEIRVQGGGKSEGISVLNNSSVSSIQSQIQKKFGWLRDEPNVLLITTGRRFLSSTGYWTKEEQHDQPLDSRKLDWHKGLQVVLDVLGRNHTLVTNGATLAYGVWFREKNGDEVERLFSKIKI